MTEGLPVDRSGSDRYDIPTIIELVRRGVMRVPKFQRGFVWTSNDVRKLFDSIYRGFPVGTVLLWRHTAPAEFVRFGPLELQAEERTDALWVVDGQQRITSLVACLSPGVAPGDGSFDLYFDLETRKFVYPRAGMVSPRSIPLRGIYESRRLIQWLREHDDDLESDDFEVAEDVAGAIRDYKVPAYVVADNDQRTLREIFDRVNSAGKPITRAQVFHALFATGSDSSSPAAVVAELRTEGFGQLKENRVVQSVLAIRGGDVQRDLHDEFGELEDPDDWYDSATAALVRSFQFLKAEGVPHLDLVPNTLPIPVLAAFFYLHPDPEPWTLRLLSRWIWRGWVHGFGREGGQTPTLRRAIRSVYPRRGEVDQAPSEFEAVRALLEFTPDREAPRLSLTGFAANFADSRLVLLALASLGPLGSDGAPIDLAARFEKIGSKAVTELVPRNRSNAGARSFWPGNLDDFGNSPDTVRESHLVTSELLSMATSGDYDAFVSHRGRALTNLAEQFLAARLDFGAVVRPAIKDLVARGAGAEDD